MRTLLLLLAMLAVAAACANSFGNLAYTPKPVEAKVPGYTVKPDLSNVENSKILPKLTDEQRKALVEHGFVARPTAEEQLFYVYENNAYKKIGSFVTTDSVLHTYHIFYDFTLRYLEKERLFGAVKTLSRRMLDVNLAALKEKHVPEVKTALTRNAVYFAVPLALLGEKLTLPAEVQILVNIELGRIAAHAKYDNCITGAEIDYTQFIPRGHYTRSEAFQKYFKAMMWYGLAPMELEPKSKSDRPTLQALIITEQLGKDARARELWMTLYDPTVFYVGKTDDLSYYQYAPLLTRVFGRGELDRLANTAKIAAFRTLAKQTLPAPGIANSHGRVIQGQQFRFMGQRFIPDSRILQELTDPKVADRGFPLGLDVFAVLGNPRAQQLLDETYQQTKFGGYLEQRAKLQAEVAKLTPQDWQQNLYYGWMYCLLPLQTPRPEGYPAFMRNQAWQEKSLLTSLGSWTELRHDTILYAKQSVAECGEGGDEPPPVLGYVEPEPQLYERLAWLIRLNKAGLIQRKLLTPKDEMAHSFDEFAELNDFLARCARKELLDQPLSKDELRALERYGGQLERLMMTLHDLTAGYSSTGWWNIESKTDRNMALVADVHTENVTQQVLEEAVGSAAEIWVVAPIQGKLRLTRGAIFTYYEFKHPMKDRLTDETWQQMLQKGTAPAMPEWIRDFLLPPGPNVPVSPHNMEQMQTGC